MEDFKIKLDKFSKTKEEIDDYIWDIFNAYIEQEEILFSSPYEWSVSDDCIYFSGRDGSRGCYDSMSIIIPLPFFENPKEEFLKLKKKKEDKEKTAEKYKIKMDWEKFDCLKRKHGW